MSGATWARIGAIVAGLAVVTGAFGAHGLEGKVDPERLGTWEIGSRYQMYHGLALIAVGLLAMRAGPSRSLTVAGGCFLFGIVVFSGTLYALVLAGGTADRLGAITPIGGLGLIAGWFALAVACRTDVLGAKPGSLITTHAGVPAEDPQRVA